MRLAEMIHSLSPDHLRRLSRIRIEPHPGRSTVTMHIAGMQPRETLGVHNGGAELHTIPRGPVSMSKPNAVADRNPPVKLIMLEAIPDITGVIDTLDLRGQISELEQSGVVGKLNVERSTSGATIVSTHAGTQGERNDWLRALSK